MRGKPDPKPGKQPLPENTFRLNQYLARCGLGSRRKVDGLIAEGRVSVGGEPTTDFSLRVGPGDRVEVDGRPVAPRAQTTVLLFHKPPGYLCAREDPFGRSTIYELLPLEQHRLHHVGRLDASSRGLLLLTDDGELTQRLLHPSGEIRRRYWLRTKEWLRPEQESALRAGVTLESGHFAKPLELSGQGRDWQLVLAEGKNREVRKMLEAVGSKVIDLFRTSFGKLTLGNLPEGDFRRLSEQEIGLLFETEDTDRKPNPSVRPR